MVVSKENRPDDMSTYSKGKRSSAALLADEAAVVVGGAGASPGFMEMRLGGGLVVESEIVRA